MGVGKFCGIVSYWESGQSFPVAGVVGGWVSLLGKVGVGWPGVVVVGGSLPGRYCMAP